MPKGSDTIRPTKKQKQLLGYIDQFIKEHGYSPSYREIMRGCGYSSVATVALHVSSLIARGHLRKRDRSARSIEVVHSVQKEATPAVNVAPSDEKWLIDLIEQRLASLEQGEDSQGSDLADVRVLTDALRIIGATIPADLFAKRIAQLHESEVQ